MMRQRLHPDETWARPYAWRDVDTGDLKDPRQPSSVKAVGRDLLLEWQSGISCRAAAVAAGIVRLEWNCPGATPLPPNGGVVIQDGARDPDAVAQVTPGVTSLRTGGWVLSVTARGGFVWGAAESAASIEWKSVALKPSDRGMRLLADFALSRSESIHGCGGRTGPVNRRGTTCDFFSIKVDGPKYGDYGGLPMPFVMTSRGAGLFFDNPWPHVYADFGYEQSDRMRWYAPGGPARWYLLAGPAPVDVMRRWHLLTGEPALPPDWYFGIWMSYCSGTTAVDWAGWVDKFREGGWPLDVIVLDLEWRGGSLIAGNEGGEGTGLEWHSAFGDGAALIRHAEKAGVKVCLHLNTRQYGPGIARRGIEEGWLRQVGEQVVVDPSTPEKAAKAWELHAARVAEGAQLWWTDNGERVEGELGEGLPSRNLFGARWNEFLFRGMTESGLDNRLVLSRGDWVGAQRHCTPWPGDTCPGVDRLGEDIRFILNCAVSGVPFAGTDLGGFHESKKDGEVMTERMRGFDNMVRRLIHGFLYQPVARIHNSGPVQKFPWALPETLQRLFRVYAELRYRLMPWWRSAAVRACEEGVPIVRPLWFDYPEDRALRDVADEMLVGDGLLAAPVVNDSAWDRVVRLPEGTWYDYWTGTAYEGGRDHIIDAPPDAVNGLPLFVRAGTVLVYGPETVCCRGDSAGEFWLDPYPGTNSRGCLKTGAGAEELLSWEASSETVRVSSARAGTVLHVNTGRRIVDSACAAGTGFEYVLEYNGAARGGPAVFYDSKERKG